MCSLTIHHWLFWRKSAQDTGSFENGNSVQKKKMAYTIFKWKFTCSTDKPHVIIKNTSLQRNQNNDIYFIETGLLIFRAVAEPRNSGKSAKSREIHKTMKNTVKFGRNLILFQL